MCISMKDCGCFCHCQCHQYDDKDKQKFANKVLYISVILNAFLSVSTAIGGIVGRSQALLSDSLHIFSDVLMTIAAVTGIKIARRKPDRNHHYGHEKIETFFSCMLSLVLIITSFGIGLGGIKGLFHPSFDEEERGNIAILISILCLIVKESMYRMMKGHAEKIGSDSIMADACHQRIDAFSSLGVFISLLGSKVFNCEVLENIVAIFICLITAKSAIKIYINSIKELTDASAPEDTVKKIEELAETVEEIKKVESIKTRLFAKSLHVDLEVTLDGEMSVKNASIISKKVKDKIKGELIYVKECVISFKPAT